MDPEVKRELEEIHALVRDTHTLLRTVRRHQILEFYGKWIIYLVLIFGGGYLIWQYVEPIISAAALSGSEFEKLLQAYGPYK